ncbi:MAG: M15 family metallopeptidase [Synechocystis sp.]|jgi:D-alanyl-D-alanine dipeptidase
MKPYLSVPIQECGEPLAPIAIEGVQLLNPPPYQQLGADYQGRSPFCLRTGVLQALVTARQELVKQQPDWQILVFDAYRPIAVQQFMVDYTFGQILQRDRLTTVQLTDTQRANIYDQVYQIWALPSPDPKTPPPHSTGAALDITLLDETGNPVAMGGEIDELSPRSQPDYYRQLTPKNSTEAQTFAQYQQQRDLLNTIMETAGFLRHPGEWWHFSKGDQFWAWQQNQRRSTEYYFAHYGRVE